MKPIIFVLSLAALAATLVAADWDQWRGGPGRNGVSSETSLPADLKPGRDGDLLTSPQLRWAACLGSQTYSTPTIAEGKVYIGTNDWNDGDRRFTGRGGGLLLCLSEKTGKLLWKLRSRRYEKKVYGSNFDDLKSGICSSPTVNDGQVFVVTNRAEVLCLDADGLADGNDGSFRDEGRYLSGDDQPVVMLPGDADILWKFDLIADAPSAPHDVTHCNVLVDERFVYVNTGNGVHRIPGQPTPLPDAPSLVALDRKTGKLIAADEELIGRRVFHGQWSSPAMGTVGRNSLIFFGGGDGVLYAFRRPKPKADKPPKSPLPLKTAWTFNCNPPEFRTGTEGKPIDYWAGDASRAKLPAGWKGPNEIIATPVFHDGRVYVATGRDPEHGLAPAHLHCIEATGNGKRKTSQAVWTYSGLSRSISTPVVADGLVYAADLAGDIHCIDAKTGKLVWKYRSGEEIWSSPLVADGKVYIGTQRRKLLILKAGRKKPLPTKIRLPSRLSATPVAANGTLYLATHKLLLAFETRPRQTSRPADRP
ncbi:MAG: PQQ-binding-like beta-propeller repeat protein [Phycisphaerae bacterium]